MARQKEENETNIKQENLTKKAAYKWAKEEQLDPDLFLYWGLKLITYSEFEKIRFKMTGR